MFKKLFTFLLTFSAALAIAAVDVNKANHTELLEVKGIGPATATRIMDARKQGPFKNWEDLIARVKGIAANSANKLSEGGLTINGQSYPKTDKAAAKPHNSVEKSVKPTQTASKKPEKG